MEFFNSEDGKLTLLYIILLIVNFIGILCIYIEEMFNRYTERKVNKILKEDFHYSEHDMVFHKN